MVVSLLVMVLLVSVSLFSPAAAQDCSLCHGSPVNAAPPVDVSGNSATSFSGVGAHQSHLGPSTWRAEIACSECHLVPATIGDPGHADTALPAELTWGPLATSEGATPSWNGTTCSGTYCHGATLPDGGATPVWTDVGVGEAACGTCHDLPGGMHACSDCHPNINSDLTFSIPSRHIDGFVTLFPLTGVHGDGHATFSLRQNVPNPFNPATRISYSVASEQQVLLVVYDVSGRELEELVNEVKGPGDYAAQWDAEGLPSGIYFYRLTAGNKTLTRKMVLLK